MAMASSSSSTNPSSTGMKTYFKTPEGRYKLQYEKTHSAGIMHYSHGKSVSQVGLEIRFIAFLPWYVLISDSEFEFSVDDSVS